MTKQHADKLDDLWDTGGHFARLVKYARSKHDHDWFRQHLEFESKATVIKVFELALVPGLLQTENYARALLTTGQVVQNVEKSLEARMARHEILNRAKPPLLWVLLDESVIDRRVGSAEVMREQLRHLLELSEHPTTTIRVVPRRAGEHLGLEGAFTIHTTPEEDIVYLEACGGGRLSADKAEVDAYTVRFDRIGALALPVPSSRSLITSTLEAMR